MSSPSKLQFRPLRPGYEALGLVIDFLTQAPPFEHYRSGILAAAIKYQLLNGCHIGAVDGEKLVGYAGWLRITTPMGEAWVSGALRELSPVPAAEADAVALTTVRSDLPDAVRGLIRSSRRMESGRRVFFKRDYAEGETRRNTVFNAG